VRLPPSVNHLVQLYREAQRPIRTVVSTHHALFFNVLHYELQNHVGKPLQCIFKRDRRIGGYLLAEQAGDTPQFYHVAALADLWLVAQSGQARTFHFNILRTILEKTALFLGHRHFSECIKKAADDADAYRDGQLVGFADCTGGWEIRHSPRALPTRLLCERDGWQDRRPEGGLERERTLDDLGHPDTFPQRNGQRDNQQGGAFPDST